jgi:hypothetical protein
MAWLYRCTIPVGGGGGQHPVVMEIQVVECGIYNEVMVNGKATWNRCHDVGKIQIYLTLLGGMSA